MFYFYFYYIRLLDIPDLPNLLMFMNSSFLYSIAPSYFEITILCIRCYIIIVNHNQCIYSRVKIYYMSYRLIR